VDLLLGTDRMADREQSEFSRRMSLRNAKIMTLMRFVNWHHDDQRFKDFYFMVYYN